MTLPGLRAAVDTLSPEVRHAAGVHFGWWDAAGTPREVPAGKMIRPALVLACAHATGAGTAQAVPAAVAVELAHNASLLHDDVIDHDATRRGRPTLWVELGTPAAILTGDALFFLAVQTLTRAGGPLAERGGPDLIHTIQRLIGGEYVDTLLEGAVAPRLSVVEEMAGAKTGALIARACALGALAGGAPESVVEDLAAFGTHLGAAFQLVDDVLGIWGEERLTGKPAHSDLRSRKKSLPVTAALTADHPAARALDALYRRAEPFGTAELPGIAALIAEAGGRTWAEARAAHHIAEAHRHLAAARPSPRAERVLTALADLVTHRNH
ncbi:polyprenyl synthetase family protein (plasmid) [Streptomyces sp. BI20]|uniref:polyprenyl synthetase family protein n=1 Tax=Streptomyces sp. BI20 TaxID=3403460 RepID=UPI003C733367